MRTKIYVPSRHPGLCKNCGRTFYDHPVEEIYGPGQGMVARCPRPEDPAEQERRQERERMADLGYGGF